MTLGRKLLLFVENSCRKFFLKIQYKFCEIIYYNFTQNIYNELWYILEEDKNQKIMSNVSSVYLIADGIVVLKNDGTLVSMGYNKIGELGYEPVDSNFGVEYTPVEVDTTIK